MAGYQDAFKGAMRVKAISGLFKLNFGGATPNVFDSVAVDDTISSAVNCAGFTQGTLAIEYSAANVTAKFRIILLDWNSTIGTAWSWLQPSKNTGNQTYIRETGYFHGEFISFLISGATQFRVLVTSITNAGSVSTWASVE